MKNYNNAVNISGAGSQPSPGPILVPPISRELLPAVGVSAELTAQHLAVLGAWFCLYCPDREAQQVAALAKHFSQEASFEDNFVQVFGHRQLGALMYALRRATSGISLAIEKVELLPTAYSLTGARCNSGMYQLRITGRHSFYFPALIRGPLTSLVLPPALTAWATDTLTVREADHVVIHWQQRVHNIPTAPWLLRAFLGSSIGLFLRHVLGW